MGTPDRTPGPLHEEELNLEQQGSDPTNAGAARYVSGSFRMRDSIGVFNPRGGLPAASAVGQVMFSTDGTNFTAQTPLTSTGSGWLVNQDGILLVQG